jgi:Flp pilus assembly protein TadD
VAKANDTAPTAPAAVAPPAEVASVAAPPPPAAEAHAGAAAAAEPVADPTARAKEASRARETARAALERGALKEAISAGERSVALDGTDGESWLILGAAYQQGGDLASARRSYRACIDQGRRGPRSECAQMLR